MAKTFFAAPHANRYIHQAVTFGSVKTAEMTKDTITSFVNVRAAEQKLTENTVMNADGLTSTRVG